MNSPCSTLLFVYNADSGLANALIDHGKKYLAPSTYECQLCMVSYGPFGMRKEWKSFIAQLPYTVEFLHRDEFRLAHPNIDTSLPAMLLLNNQTVEVLLRQEDFHDITSLNQLQSVVLNALHDRSTHQH